MNADSEEDRRALPRQVGILRGAVAGLADALSMVGVPSALLTAAAEKAIVRRRDEARAILERELAAGDVDLQPKILAQVDESAAIMLRYLRAADEGTRARNLRLMARAFRRQVDEDRADAGSFQQTAASIEDLTDAELRLLGGWLAFGLDRSLFDYREFLGIPNETDESTALYVVAAGLLRNGLVVPASAFGGMAYALAPSAKRLLDDLKADEIREG